MSATFIKKSDGNFYLRLTESTTSVKFAAITEANNTYQVFIPGSTIGTITISKDFTGTGGVIYYSASATPIPSGGVLTTDFGGVEITYTFSGSGIRDYLLSYSTQLGLGEPGYPGPGSAIFYLGGQSLGWGDYAYPGSGYINLPIAVGVKDGGVWKNSGNIFIKSSGVWKECETMYVKQSGTWEQIYKNYNNSSWINLLEGVDDAIDFGMQVIALN